MELRPLTPDAPASTFQALKRLFRDLYTSMEERGLSLPLASEGEEAWIQSIRKTLGKVHFVILAFEDARLIGFGEASLRIGPAYLGQPKTGRMEHLYIVPEARTKKAGQKIIADLEARLNEQKVHSIDLEIQEKNAEGRAFWRKMGYGEEFVQMRKVL